MLSSSLFPPGLRPYDQCWQQCWGTKVPTSNRTKTFTAILRRKKHYSVHANKHTNHYLIFFKKNVLSTSVVSLPSLHELLWFILVCSPQQMHLHSVSQGLYTAYNLFSQLNTSLQGGSQSGIKEHLQVTCRAELTLRGSYTGHILATKAISGCFWHFNNGFWIYKTLIHSQLTHNKWSRIRHYFSSS